jgi:F0F1-type ATP synthase epsilon subunit
MSFQDGCLLYQRKFKILYAQVQEITCIKLHPIVIREKENKKKEIIVIFGFQDGAI